MAGLSGELRCDGFIESSAFQKSKDELKRNTGLTDRQIDDRLEGLVWALLREPSAVSERVGNRNLWVAVTPVGYPNSAYISSRARGPGANANGFGLTSAPRRYGGTDHMTRALRPTRAVDGSGTISPVPNLPMD